VLADLGGEIECAVDVGAPHMIPKPGKTNVLEVELEELKAEHQAAKEKWRKVCGR
jgi:hypothetical protein